MMFALLSAVSADRLDQVFTLHARPHMPITSEFFNCAIILFLRWKQKKVPSSGSLRVLLAYLWLNISQNPGLLERSQTRLPCKDLLWRLNTPGRTGKMRPQCAGLSSTGSMTDMLLFKFRRPSFVSTLALSHVIHPTSRSFSAVARLSIDSLWIVVRSIK
jgi:hypothetical protein